MINSECLHLMKQYEEDVLSGEIVAPKTIHNAIKRNRRDLERSETDEFPYYFDEKRAHIAINFYAKVLKHSIGEYAGLPFLLAPWQAWGTGLLHGWRRLDDDARRFRHCYWSQARKNGKSSYAAGQAIFMSAFDANPTTGKAEAVAQIILSATKKEQASKVIFAECKRMVEQTRELDNASMSLKDHIDWLHNKGTIMPVGSDRAFDGLNPSMVITDEKHEFREHHRDFLATMRTGGGSRLQPLFLTTTTAGSDKSWVWLEEYRYAMQVLAGTVHDEKWLVICYEIDPDDDPFDESVWIKANPNLGTSVKLEYLQDNARFMKGNALTEKEFTRYHCNRIVSSTTTAFDMDLWDKAAGELSDWSEANAIGGGIDIGTRDDFAAWAFVARFPLDEDRTDEDGNPLWRYEIRTQAFVGEDSDRDLTSQPFADWVHFELLKKTKYPISDLCSEVIDFSQRFQVADVAYDPANAQQLAETMEQQGVLAASMQQTTGWFNEPIRDFDAALRDGRVKHSGCPLLRWCVSNAALISDHQNRVMFSKRDSAEKIDPVVAFTMAYRRAMIAPGKITGPLVVF